MVSKMGKVKGSKTCAFCKATISTELSGKVLQKFYTQFLTASTDLDDINDNIKSKRSKVDKIKSFGKAGKLTIPDKWAVCEKCMPDIQLVLQSKENVNKVESQVRKMQLELLKELDKLLVEMGGMNKHLKNIEHSLITAKSLETPKKSAGRSSLRKQNENDEFIGIFEEKLIKAFNDIQDFQMETSRKLLKNPVNRTTFSQISQPACSENSTENFYPIVKSEPADLTSDQPDEDNLDNLSNFDDGSNDNYYYDDDDCEMTVDAPENDNPPIKHERKSTQSKATIDIPSSESEDDQKSCSSDSDFDPDTQLSYPSTSKSTKGLSKFRKSLISRIQKRHTIATSPHHPKDLTDPRRPFHIKYTSSKFLLEDHEILCLDSPQILQCATCSFQVQNPPYSPRKPNNPEDQMFEHILSKHLLLYTCTTCCKSFETLYTLKSHKLTHLTPELQPKVPCPICQKPISASSSNNLKGHQWTHLNAEEKRDPKNAHLMPTKIRQYFIEGRKNECATCGKDFVNRSHLRCHERTHLSMEDRREDKVICTICGREIFKTSFRAHENLCGKERKSKKEKVSCPVCGAKCKNNKWLDIHAGEVHPGEKIFGCGVCGKMYGSMAYLHNHMESHDTVKKYVCEGCGLGYQQKRNLKRHREAGGCRGNIKREVN